MRGEYRDTHRGLPDLPGLSRRLPALAAVRVGDNCPWGRSEDPHQLQPAFWSGGQRLQVRVHSSLSLSSPSPTLLCALLNPAWIQCETLPPIGQRVYTAAPRELEVQGWDMAQRLLAITLEEMGFDGFCNSYLIRREGVLWHVSVLGVFGRNLEEKLDMHQLFYWLSSVCS